MHASVLACTHRHTHALTHTHTHINTHTHTRKQISKNTKEKRKTKHRYIHKNAPHQITDRTNKQTTTCSRFSCK